VQTEVVDGGDCRVDEVGSEPSFLLERRSDVGVADRAAFGVRQDDLDCHRAVAQATIPASIYQAHAAVAKLMLDDVPILQDRARWEGCSQYRMAVLAD